MAKAFWACIVAAVVALGCGPTFAQAPQVNPNLRAAELLYESLEYEAALNQLSRAREATGLSTADQVEIETLTGVIQLSLGRRDAGRTAFYSALALDPGAQLPAGVSPKIRTEWEEVRGSLARVEHAHAASPPASVQPDLKPLPPGGSPGNDPMYEKVTPAEASPQNHGVSYALMGVGLVALAGSAAAAVIGSQDASSARSENRTGRPYASTLSTANTAGNLGWGLLAAGVAIGGVGGALYLTGTF